MTSAQRKHRLRRIIPFGIIWFVCGMLYCVVEKGILADSTTYPLRGNPYDFKASLITVGLSTTVMGLFMGAMEVYFLGGLFRKRSFLKHMVTKTVIYMAAIILFHVVVMEIYYLQHLHLPLADGELLRTNLVTFSDYTFWSIIAYVCAVVVLSLLYAEVSHHIGHGVIRNFFTGRYHTPKEEERIFMFLDMKSSTTIAEQMGHVRYFELLNRYYADMADAILASSGEICAYVGDEIVITWPLSEGLRDNNCLECFFRIKQHLDEQAGQYMKAFGRVPGFKAGLHCGHVTTGEIGTVRKDIIFSGDVMNTTARIQSLCNEHGVDLLVSGALMSRLQLNATYHTREIGERDLKGKDEKVILYTVMK